MVVGGAAVALTVVVVVGRKAEAEAETDIEVVLEVGASLQEGTIAEIAI